MSRKTRKLMWSVPLIAAVAVIGALAAFMTLVPNPAAADGAPGPVTGLKASEIGRHHVVLSWTAPTTGTVDGYRIDISSDGFVWMERTPDTGSNATTYTVGSTTMPPGDDGLKAGTGYYFRVYALNGEHTGPYSIRPLNLSVRTADAIAPTVVTGLMATDDLTKMITLTWQQPAYDGGADVVRYCIRARGVQANAAFAGLTADNCGPTAAGANVAKTTNAAIQTAITALNTDPQTDPTVPIVVEAKDVEADDGSATFTLAKTNNDTPNDATDDVDLGDGVTAMFQVVAVNSKGQSIASNIDEGKTADAAATPDPTAPGAPANLKIVGADTNGSNSNSVSFYWNRPAGLPETGVTVQVQRQVFASGTGWSPINTTGGWVEVEHNTAAADTNGLVGAGTAANHAQFVDDPETAINVATGKVRYRVRYVANELTSGWVHSQELSFPFPQATAHGYETDGSDTVGTVVSLPVIAGDNATTTDAVEGLRRVNDMGYFHRIDLAWDRNEYCRVAGTVDGSAACITRGQPSTYAVDVMDAGEGATALVAAEGADADWDFLTDTISATRTRYEHHSSGDKGATMLVSDEHRHYRVFPWHAGRYGYPMVIIGNTKEASVPGRIPNGGLSVTANGDDKLNLSWSPASNDGGSPVTGYIIQVSTDRDNNTARDNDLWCDVEHQEVSDPPVASDRMYTYDGTIHSIAHSGAGVVCADATDPPSAPLTATGEALAAGYGRWFRVIALNKKSTAPADVNTGWTIDSDSGDQAIPAFGRTGAAAPPGAETAPSAPIGLVAEEALNVHSEISTDKGVLLTWNVPEKAGTLLGGAPAMITDYVIQVSVDGGAWETLEDGMMVNATDWTHSSPLPTTTEQRVYRVAAVNATGQGPWSNMAYYSTTSMVDPDHTHAAPVLMAPSNVMASSDAPRTMSLSWEDGDNADFYILVAYDIATGDLQLSTEMAPATSGDVTGLTPGSRYLGLVIAVKGSGADVETMYGYDGTNIVTSR